MSSGSSTIWTVPEEKIALDEVLTIYAFKHLGLRVGDEKIMLAPPPLAASIGGEYEVGSIQYAGVPPYPFTLYRKDVLRHLFIVCGRAAWGKTTLIFGLQRQFLQDGMPFMAFDWKRNYRSLLQRQACGTLDRAHGRPGQPHHCG